MNINIDYGIRTPIYMQVVEEVERLVATGLLKPSDQIPSIREVACNLGINPNTVKKAYDLLESRGIIISKSTKGTFIQDDVNKAKELKIEAKLEEIRAIIRELETYGLDYQEILKKIN